MSLSAARLAQETSSEQLSDMHIFAEVRQVIEALKQHDCSAALAWCADNRSRLKKIKSSLEFKLRLQEFIELVRKVCQQLWMHAIHVACLLVGPHLQTLGLSHRPLISERPAASDTYAATMRLSACCV